MAHDGDRLRRVREARGLSVAELARRARISRQALGAIEAGAYAPGVTVALALARELGATVEELFGAEPLSSLDAAIPPHSRSSYSRGTRVALARVNGRLIAVVPPSTAFGLAPATGVIQRPRGTRATVDSFRTAPEIDSALLVAGCDPAVSLLADYFARRRASANLVALPSSSAGALAALADGRAHVAGVHLRDAATGDYNLAYVRRALGRTPVMLVNFARWELGLAVAAGNPLAIRGFDSIARRGVRLINRELGSGARLALDEALRDAGLNAKKIAGYEREAQGHLEVAAEIAAARADVGVTIRIAADVHGLSFVPIREERYDLAIRLRDRDEPPLRAMLSALASSAFAREVSAFCGYDTRDMGKVVPQFG